MKFILQFLGILVCNSWTLFKLNIWFTATGGVIDALDTLFRGSQFVLGSDRAKLVDNYDVYVKIGVPISAALTPAQKKFKSII